MTLSFLPSLGLSLALVLAAMWVARGPHPHRVVLLLLAGGLVVVHAALYRDFTVDDSFISYRFARNWAEGLGPVYQNSDRVEGYTSFAWTALLAAATRLGAHAEHAAKWLGLGCALATLPACFGLARRLAGSERAAWIAPFALALSPLFAAWVHAGMDAPLFACVVTWALWAHAVDCERARAFPLGALLIGLSVWVRPEGALLALAVWASRWFGPEPPRERLGRALRFGAVAALAALPFWAGRWAYYGDFFPNTYYAKTRMSADQLRSGARSLAEFAGYVGAAFMALALVPLFSSRWKEPALRSVGFALTAYVAYVVAIGGDVLHLRLFVHVLPLLAACVAAGAGSVALAFRELRIPIAPRRLAALAVVLGIGWQAAAYQQDATALRGENQFGAAYVVHNSRNLERANIPLGHWLREHANHSSRLAAWDVGGTGYYSRLPMLDLYGLTDATLARLNHEGASSEERMRYFERQSPELLLTYGTREGAVLGWLDSDRTWLDAHYTPRSAWPNAAGDALVLFARIDIELPPRP